MVNLIVLQRASMHCIHTTLINKIACRVCSIFSVRREKEFYLRKNIKGMKNIFKTENIFLILNVHVESNVTFENSIAKYEEFFFSNFYTLHYTLQLNLIFIIKKRKK